MSLFSCLLNKYRNLPIVNRVYDFGSFSEIHIFIMEKKIIGVDCDEVLCLLIKDFITDYGKMIGLNLKYEDFKEYDFKKYFHLTDEKVVIAFGNS